jgi:hypothetical protein
MLLSPQQLTARWWLLLLLLLPLPAGICCCFLALHELLWLVAALLAAMYAANPCLLQHRSKLHACCAQGPLISGITTARLHPAAAASAIATCHQGDGSTSSNTAV